MACLTGPRRKGRVHHFLEKFRVLGRMGIMAMPAIHVFRVDPDMGLHERITGKIVTVAAQIRDLLDKKGWLGRKMGFMARLTVSSGRSMNIFLAHPLLHVLVAGKAEVRARCQQKALQF
jgi:hypothetical protein